MKIVLVLFFLIPSFSFGKCQEKIEWKTLKVGSIVSGNVTDFTFLTPQEILVASFPKKGKTTAPLLIYRNLSGEWKLDQSKSKQLPQTMHPRQLTYKKFSDGEELLVIADHGTDEKPFPGALPRILRKEKSNWVAEKEASSLDKDFTFNLALAETLDKKKFLFKGNVHGKTAPLFIRDGKRWKNYTDKLPKELKPGGLCMMTAVADDFNNDGNDEIFLGGCDMEKASPSQAQDRLLSYSEGEWKLASSSTFPSRMEDSRWGTVFTKVLDFNRDGRKDILVATHDFGFHRWRVLVYVNESTSKNFKFVQKLLPLVQEKKTEGFVYAVEDFSMPFKKTGYLSEVRSVIRDPSNSPPTHSNRLLISDGNQLTDATECLPDLVKGKLFHAKKFPNSGNKVLLISFEGEIYTLEAIPALNR